MVFSSFTFIYFFLPIVMILYYISPMKIKNFIIFVSGLVFYAWGEPVYIILMIISILIDYTAGRLIDYFDSSPKKRTICLLISVVMNIGLLGVFKYGSFVVKNINAIFGLNIPDPELPLPIGISFYTFQSMSYTIDLYLRKIKVQKNIISYASYVVLFPQLIAGPIVRYEDVAKEIDERSVNVSLSAEGIGLFVKGLSKKVLLANNIGLLWSQIKDMDYANVSVLGAWIGILAFTFQIYFDFSGYSDMACGMGKMLGFNFPKNFEHPYVSRSISEFWRRWHITLGSWFRSYVYIPLGGNRCGMLKQIRNLLVVWFLTGLWHGASWNFVLWGLYFGALIIIERIGFGKVLEKLPAPVSTAYTFLMVVFGWVLFETDSLSKAFSYFKAMFGGAGVLADKTAIYLLTSNLFIFALCIFASTEIFSKVTLKLRDKNEKIFSIFAPMVQVVLMLVCTAYLADASYNPFLYFRF